MILFSTGAFGRDSLSALRKVDDNSIKFDNEIRQKINSLLQTLPKCNNKIYQALGDAKGVIQDLENELEQCKTELNNQDGPGR